MMSFMFHFLAKRPDLQDLLRQDTSKIVPFVDETLRRFPITNGVRLITGDIEFAGAQLKAGEMIVCPMSIANLDDRHYENPTEFDMSRTRKDHVTFFRWTAPLPRALSCARRTQVVSCDLPRAHSAVLAPRGFQASLPRWRGDGARKS